MGARISPLLRHIVTVVVICAVGFLVFSYNHGNNAVTRMASHVKDDWWGKEYPKVDRAPQSEATIVAQSSNNPPVCQECIARRDRYRAAIINPEIIIRPNSLEIAR